METPHEKAHTIIGHLDHLYDLRHVSLAEVNIATAVSKKRAQELAKQLGWAPSAVFRAYNRFWRFWVVGVYQGDDLGYSCATEDGKHTRIPVRKIN